jgi:hypothetical protein
MIMVDDELEVAEKVGSLMFLPSSRPPPFAAARQGGHLGLGG